ncbi:MAG: hypothetical protein R2779_07735 [Crocinitomicaceae bacterium]
MHSTLDEDVYIIAGVPSWTMVLIKRVLQLSGKKTLKEVWLTCVYRHG